MEKAKDWGEASEKFDAVKEFISGKDLSSSNEAQTRYDVIDRMIREVLGWQHGQVSVEEREVGADKYVDYVLRSGDYIIVLEAKRHGACFPTPTDKGRLKLGGSVLGTGEVAEAIKQAHGYGTAKLADVVVVTNGPCWCLYSMKNYHKNAYAHIVFPFDKSGHAEALWGLLSEMQVRDGGLRTVTNDLPPTENRIIQSLSRVDGRVDRNTIADHIGPALDHAMYADALLKNDEVLKRCFVPTEARTKFDSLLGVHLADIKPEDVKPAKRIRTGSSGGAIEQDIRNVSNGASSPVTLIIGPVGAGKSTYLAHFERIACRELLVEKRTHWIYVDFERMGPHGNPREFLYARLRDFLLADHPENPTDFKNVVEPAYAEEVAALARGPLAIYFKDKVKFDERIAAHIEKDFEQVEPYVDKVLRYIATKHTCVVVLDNIDLFEDEKLETSVFAEGLALSKRTPCKVIVSLRDTTFVRHRSDAVFNAYELKKLWLDPPPFKAVLSARLTYSKKVLEGVKASIPMVNGMHLEVPDLSSFFDIIQRSVLQGEAGDYVESISDLNIRRGLSLIANFLTSGHVQADRALKRYLTNGQTNYRFPFHEVFKGTMLAQWKHFREDRSEGINVFDSRLGARRLRLLRLHLLQHLIFRAALKDGIEVPCAELIDLFSRVGGSESQIIECLNQLWKAGLIRSLNSSPIESGSSMAVSRSGGYYVKMLAHRFAYVDECLYDTCIDDTTVWDTLSSMTVAIESSYSIVAKMRSRRERINVYLDYLRAIEQEALGEVAGGEHLFVMDSICEDVRSDADDALARTIRYTELYSRDR